MVLKSLSSFGAVEFKVVAPKIAPTESLRPAEEAVATAKRKRSGRPTDSLASMLPVIIACHAGTCPKAALTEND